MNHRMWQTVAWRAAARQLLFLAIGGMSAYWSGCVTQRRCSVTP